MTVLFLVAAYAAVFAVCEWSGRQLAHHYQDQREVAAVVAIGACVLGSLALMTQFGLLDDAMLLAGLVAAAGGGLFAGYMRSDRAL
jgi:SNF family Na+-dependent transporter